MPTKDATGPLKGLRVLDLTRVLAGPTCTQMLGDLGAEVIKIERPGAGDDTRGFAPPSMPGTSESAYFVGVNRNKRSVTLDIATPEGQKLVKKLLEDTDILVENFKVGALAKYGLGYQQVHAAFPSIIYCSITGFGQTGPYAPRPGYDALIQAMGGVMSLTGEIAGEPQKVGIPVADVFAGLYGCIGILAALRHRDRTGQGQQVDIGMLDTHVAWLANQGMNYLATGENPPRLGNQHPNIVPYQVFPTADGYMVLSVGNDPTFKRFCDAFGLSHLLDDPRFAGDRPGRLLLVWVTVEAAVFGGLAAAGAPSAAALVVPWVTPVWLTCTLLLAGFCTLGAFSIMIVWQSKITATEAGLPTVSTPTTSRSPARAVKR